MNVNLRELAASGTPIELHGHLELSDAIYGRNDIRSMGVIEAQVTAHSEAGRVAVTGALKGTLEVICSRCLAPSEVQVVYPVTEMFTMQQTIADSNEEIHFVTEEVVNLTPYLRDAFVVQLPMAAVCREDCKGLCPECGADRNTDTCGCVRERIDPRLAGLKDFFKNES